MQIKTLTHSSSFPLHPPFPFLPSRAPPSRRLHIPSSPLRISKSNLSVERRITVTSCINPNLSANLSDDGTEVLEEETAPKAHNGSSLASTVDNEREDPNVVVHSHGLAEKQSLWDQMKEIVVFAGPAAGLWLCGPLMSLIDTAVIGQGSSIELAALGPATVICDYVCYMFMFLSVSTSNMVATSLARKDRKEVQHQISILLFIGLSCGILMLLFTRFFGLWMVTAFTGPKNIELVPAANVYIQIRGLAWPAVLIGWVAQSASLGMKDSWGPLKALAVASAVNGIGDIVLCSVLGYGIAGAAWATMASQIIAAYMMMTALNKKGYNAFAISPPLLNELMSILGLAAPVFITMTSKVVFYSLLIYAATSMGASTVAAHQVMLQIYSMCTVWGEPLSQTAQSFMPELIYGVNRSLKKARELLKSLVIIGGLFGLILGSIGTFVPWRFPIIFTADQNIIWEVNDSFPTLSFSCLSN